MAVFQTAELCCKELAYVLCGYGSRLCIFSVQAGWILCEMSKAGKKNEGVRLKHCVLQNITHQEYLSLKMTKDILDGL